jgi:hypothetical protein
MILVFLARVERTLLSVAFDFGLAFDFDFLSSGAPPQAARPAHKHERRRPEGLRRCFLDSIYSEYQTGRGKCVIFNELIFPAESMT